MIFQRKPTLDQLNKSGKETLVSQLGIEFTEVGSDYLVATMPVDSRTIQPMGLLHGGASVALAETLGSVGASLTLDPSKQACVGLEINANHLRAVRDGLVRGVASPLHLGRSTQVWEIKLFDETEKLCCISRITMAILDRP